MSELTPFGQSETSDRRCVRLTVEWVEVPADDIAPTHHWRAEALVGDDQVDHARYYTRDGALCDTLAAIENAGVDLGLGDD